MCSLRENAAVVLPEHVCLRTESDPSVLVAFERSSLSHEQVFLLTHGGRSKCAHSVRAQQFCRMNRSSLRTERDPSVLAARERSICSPERVFLRTERSKCARGV